MFHHHEYKESKRDPAAVHAWLVGADITSLAAAVHLIQDAKVPGPQIHILKNSASQSHILETLPVTQALSANNEDRPGREVYCNRILSPNYVCTNDLLSRIPSRNASNRTVQEELIITSNRSDEYEQTRVLARGISGIQILDLNRLDLKLAERARLKKMMLAEEGSLAKKRIMDIFDRNFFGGKFWSIWGTKYVIMLIFPQEG